MNTRQTRSIARVIVFTLVASVALVGLNNANAATMTSAKDTMTRLKISTTADHTIVFTLPTGIDFDRSGTTDFLRVDFPAAFSQSGTWVTGDFSFNDGTARTVSAVAQGAGTVDCTAGGFDNVCVAIDTTAHIFTIKPSTAAYTGATTGATITFTIDGTATDGTLTNPSSAGSSTIAIAQCDETASCDSAFASTHSVSIAAAIADDDQVGVTATVDPSITFDIDTAVTDTTSSPAYSVALGTITATDSRVSGSTDSINSIWIDLDTNAAGGAVVTVLNANGANGLKSTSVPADDIASTDGAIADGTERYGLCVVSVAQTTGTLAKASPYNSGTCAADSETNDVQALTTTGENILNTSAAPIAGGRARIAVNASIAAIQTAHNDYADTLTFIATGTF